MTRIGTAFSFDDIQYEDREIEGQGMRIATPESLLKMKENTMREIDQLDVNFLREKIRRQKRDDN